MVLAWYYKGKIESKLGTKLRPHQDRIDNGVFYVNLPNAIKLDIVNAILK